MTPWLYRHPDVYAALRAPDPTLLRAVDAVIAAHHRGPLGAVLDFACGPGQWLAHFSARGARTAGIDASPAMIAAARAANPTSVLAVGDMRTQSLDATFDVALEVSGFLSELAPTQLRAALDNVLSHLRDEGTLLFTVFARGSSERPTPLAWEAGPVIESGRSVSIAYRSTPAAARHDVERTVTVVYPSGEHESHVDRYALHVWSLENLVAWVDALPGATLVAAYDEGCQPIAVDSHRSLSSGEVLVVARRERSA